MAERDRSPIDQQWVRDYCDQFVKIAIDLPNGLLRDAVLRRVECAQDLVDAWQKRNWTLAERDKDAGR